MLAGIRWLSRWQAEDGAFRAPGSVFDGRELTDVGTTALALLALSGAGYSQISRDEFQDGTRLVRVGVIIRRGLQYLLRRTDREGVVRAYGDPDGRDHDMAVLALVEAAGITGSHRWAETVLACKRALPPLVLQRAAHAEFDVPAARIDPATLARELDDIDLTRNWVPTMAAFAIDGPGGATWRRWGEPLKIATIGLMERDGSFRAPHGRPGQTFAQTMGGILSLEVYYRYANAVLIDR